MKKILVLTIAMFSLLACSSSEDENIEKDPIIGTWFLFSKNGVEVDDCTKKSTYVFKENGTMEGESYTSYEGECIHEGSGIANWSSKENNIYTITPSGKTEGIDALFNFSDDFNSFYIEEDENLWKRK